MYKNEIDFIPPNSPFFHIAIIPDGGRRWAKINNISNEDSYSIMCDKLGNVLEFLFSKNVGIITVFLSSVNNFKRNNNEVLAFCEAEKDFIDQLLLPIASRYHVKIEAVGKTEDLYPDFKRAINTITEKTSLYSEKKLFLCVKYSSLQEISKAIEKYNMCDREESYVNYLDIPYPVDLLIRTGDASVMSDFLLAQCASARLFFLKKLFNDITQVDIENILNEYSHFELKYGE